MTITRIGATKKYATNWEQAFGKKDTTGKTAAKAASPPKKKGSATRKTSGKEKK